MLLPITMESGMKQALVFPGKLNKNTNGFVQFTKGFGSDVEHTWSFEGGLNFTF